MSQSRTVGRDSYYYGSAPSSTGRSRSKNRSGNGASDPASSRVGSGTPPFRSMGPRGSNEFRRSRSRDESPTEDSQPRTLHSRQSSGELLSDPNDDPESHGSPPASSHGSIMRGRSSTRGRGGDRAPDTASVSSDSDRSSKGGFIWKREF